MNDIKWLKETINEFKEENKESHEAILMQVTKINGIIGNHEQRLGKDEQKQKDHFFFHQQYLSAKRHVDNMSRAQATLLIMVIQIIAMIIIAYMR